MEDQTNLSSEQMIQEIEYEFPYHYIPYQTGETFSQVRYWSWGFRYLGGMKVVIDQLKKTPFHSLIDIGCGDGRFLREAARAFPGAELLGIDYSEKAIQLAKTMNPQLHYQNVNILSQDFTRKFDVATCVEVLEHIEPGKVNQFLYSISNLLNEGGLFIMTVPHINVPVQKKHYQHFNSSKLKEYLSPFFDQIQFIPFDVRSKAFAMLSVLLGGSGKNFIVTNKLILNSFYRLYTHKFLYASRESRCVRIAAVCRKK